jgi:hypothetical protein
MKIIASLQGSLEELLCLPESPQRHHHNAPWILCNHDNSKEDLLIVSFLLKGREIKLQS